MSAIDRFGEPTQLPVSPSYARWTGGSFRLLALQQWSEDPLLFSFPYRTLTRAGLSALPLDLCEQLPRLRVLWVDTHQGEKLEVQNLIHTTQLRRLVPPPKKHELAQSHLCEIQSIQKIIVLPCCLPHRADHNFPHHKPTAGHCVLCLCCRELSYNQIEDLPSFYHCSALQEMWVFQPPRQSHTYCIKGSSFLSLPLHIVLWLHIILYHFPNRGLQHNQIRRIESSTFQQLTSLRALWVNFTLS